MEFDKNDKSVAKRLLDDADEIGLAADEVEFLEKVYSWLEEIDAIGA